VKTIPELIRETDLPDADAMADWLESEHPDLGGAAEMPAHHAVCCAFSWRETPFSVERWGEVYDALRRAETATKENKQ